MCLGAHGFRVQRRVRRRRQRYRRVERRRVERRRVERRRVERRELERYGSDRWHERQRERRKGRFERLATGGTDATGGAAGESGGESSGGDASGGSSGAMGGTPATGGAMPGGSGGSPGGSGGSGGAGGSGATETPADPAALVEAPVASASLARRVRRAVRSRAPAITRSSPSFAAETTAGNRIRPAAKVSSATRCRVPTLGLVVPSCRSALKARGRSGADDDEKTLVTCGPDLSVHVEPGVRRRLSRRSMPRRERLPGLGRLHRLGRVLTRLRKGNLRTTCNTSCSGFVSVSVSGGSAVIRTPWADETCTTCGGTAGYVAVNMQSGRVRVTVSEPWHIASTASCSSPAQCAIFRLGHSPVHCLDRLG